MSSPIKAFIFDLDGVIVDSAEYHYQAWGQLARELGIPFDRSYNERLKGVSRMQSLELILENPKNLQAYSAAEKLMLADRKNENYKRLIEQITPADLLPGIAGLLSDIMEADLRIGLASASHNAPAIIQRLQIADSFDVIVDPGTLKQGKPDPEIFLTAAALLGVSPESCIGIEDAESGIQAIQRAGMFAVGVGDPISMQGADMILQHGEELNYPNIVEFYHKVLNNI
ncbi:beta-phosphoglucomutase [Paenibacillus graminis]|uniref:beta-phosphoglucomutase n=1 Tax=Paenibacillus graminis TaxID=189425 RepID=UPI002DB9D52F|nr:beta-phosphoglucomutase [Paenibacillus graminis]